MSDKMRDWASVNDAEGYYRDILLHGKGFKQIDHKGIARWVPIYPGDATPAPRAEEDGR